MEMFLKILCGMANSVDPDQTAPGSALFAYAILLLHSGTFRTFTVPYTNFIFDLAFSVLYKIYSELLCFLQNKDSVTNLHINFDFIYIYLTFIFWSRIFFFFFFFFLKNMYLVNSNLVPLITFIHVFVYEYVVLSMLAKN